MNPILGPWASAKNLRPKPLPTLPQHPLRRLARRAAGVLMHIFAPFLGIALGLWATWHIEMAALPVVTDFAVTSITKAPGGYVVTGLYNKRRSCELISTSVLAFNAARPEQPAHLLHQLKHQDAGANLPVGPVLWGPYTMPAPASFGNATHIRAVSLHRCHALWPHQSHYITLPVSSLPR
jgi:hypothetical protein